ncbi:actin-like ATPase domain-containing protein [Trichoderma sp. SZMC 28012]
MPRPTRTRRGTGRGTRQLPETDPSVIIGIDFGTTFSGVAWARSTRPEQINIITSWKTSFNFNSDKEKVPTSISYRNKDETPAWGYAAPIGESSLKWFKLCLLEKEDIPEYLRGSQNLQTARASLEKLGIHAVDAISDYLRELWNHSLACVERAEGASMMNLSSFKVIVTLPAIWPAYALYRMKEAIEKAGIMNFRSTADTILQFIPEPEAAALASLQDMSDRADIKTGDHFVVCDAGGGTVDIITYTVTSKDPMKVKESVKGDGKLCGATFVDERFRLLLKSKIPLSSWERLGEDGVARLMNAEWENGIKPQFCNDGRDWTIQIPFSSRKRDHDQFSSPDINITNQEIIDVFRPIMSQIVELVTAQIQEVKRRYKKLPKFVILVGGFGRCQYLFSCLKRGLKEKVEILQSSGARPWTAVCRGAALRGLEGSSNTAESAICSRIARASYGAIYNVTPWCEKEHDIRDKEWCPVTQVYIAADQASWFLRIGDTIKVGKPVEEQFHQDFNEPVDSISTCLIYSNAINPSVRCDETVKELCHIRWSSIPKYDDLPSWKNSKGQLVKRLDYIIKMTSNGVSLDFEISYKGKIVASKNVAVDYSESGVAARRSVEHHNFVDSDDDDDSGTYAPPDSERSEAPNWGNLNWDDHISSRIPGM